MTAMKHSTVVTAPFSGNIVPLNKVPDETFASGVLGEGIAIEPSDGLFCSPVNGTVETIAGTKHAIGFVADGGLEILVHVGLETVSLNGEGFEILVKEGDKVRKGRPVAKVDLDLIREGGLKTITSVVLTGGTEDMELHCASGTAEADNVKVFIDPVTCEFNVHAEKTVVEKVEDPIMEISLENAKQLNSKYELGDIVNVEIKSKEFGRIATMNAKNVILQKIREEERKVLFEEYFNL